MRASKITLMVVLSSVIIVPFGNDVWLSAIPAINHHFNTDHAQTLLSTYLLGLALAQLIYGPMSDRFGRRPVLVFGLTIFTFGCFAVVFAMNFPMLVTGRFIQAIGACSVIVSALAIVRDVYDKERIVHATSVIMAIIGVCPAIAPLLGSFLTQHFGWQGSFVFLLVLGIFYSLFVGILFAETIPVKNHDAMQISRLKSNYMELLANHCYRNYCITSAFSYSVLFSYFGISAIFIITQFHFGLVAYGAIVAINALAIFITALLVPKIAKFISLSRVLVAGASVIALGGLCMIIVNLLFTNNIYTFMAPMLVVTIGIGMIRPTASAGAMSSVPHRVAGSAAAGFNFMSFIGSAVVTTLVNFFIDHVAEYGGVILILGLMAIIAASRTLVKPAGDYQESTSSEYCRGSHVWLLQIW